MLNKIREHKLIIIITIGVVLFMLRMYALDGDLPSWGKSWYQPVDEGSYGILAINQYKYNSINIAIPNLNYAIAPHLTTNLFQYLFTYVGMMLLGNNLYGFRVGSVICVLINFILIYQLLNMLQKKYCSKLNEKRTTVTKFLIMAYLIFEFTFLMASRTVETSIYRLLFLNLTLFVYIRMKEENKLKYFLLGFITTFSVTGIYITNLFLFIATIIIILLMLLKREKKINKMICVYFFLGCLLAYGVCEVYFYYFWNTSILQNTFDTITNFSSFSEYTSSENVFQFINRFIHFFSNNFNLYNIAILLIFLLAMPKLIIYIYKNKDKTIFFILSIYITFFLQTMISEDFIIRKYLIVAILPILLLYIYYCVNISNCIHSKSVYFTIGEVVYKVLCTSFCIFILLYRLKLNTDGSNVDFSKLDKYAIFIPSFIASILILIISTYNLFRKVPVPLKKVFCILVYILSISVNLYMSFRNVYTSNITYIDKEIMIDLLNYDKLDSKPRYLVGAYAHGFSLYNDFLPIIDNYEEMLDNMIYNSEIYFFDYSTSTSWNESYGASLNKILSDKGYKLDLIKSYPRAYKTLGISRDLALYKLVEIGGE